jgi:hypothetical protein
LTVRGPARGLDPPAIPLEQEENVVMQKGLSLRELGLKVAEMKNNSKDFIAAPAQMNMQIREFPELIRGKEVTVRKPVLELYGALEDARPILPLAHNQLGGYLGIPGRYYDRMMEEQPELLALNANAWFKHNAEDREERNRKRMIRTIASSTRAFLSDRYQRVDNWEILEVVIPILAQIQGIKIVSAECTDKRLYIQATTPKIAGEIKKGDVVQAGVTIGNSEVGCGAVSVAGLIYRLLCLNGMVGQDRFRQSHVGRKIDDNEDLYSDETRKLDDRLVLSRVKDMVTAALDEGRFKAAVEKMTDLAGAEIKAPNVVHAVEVLAPKIGASETEKSGILAALIEGKDLSAWGLLNAVTAQAHKVKDYDRSFELEQAGGQLLNMGASEWKTIIEATESPVRRKRKEVV